MRFLIFTIALLVGLGLAAHLRSQSAVPPLDNTIHAGPTFVGATTCASCHQPIHDTWKSARHSKMLQPATTTSVVGDFSKQRVMLRGSRYGLQVENGRFFITESYLTGTEQKHLVEYTLGSRRIQHYLTTIENGAIIVLPPSWDVQRREWFHNMEIIRPDEDDHKRVQQWNKSCVGCHVSEEEVNYQPATARYATRWMDFGTACERCHGPGSAHVEQYRRSEASRPVSERLIVRPTRLNPQTSSMICAQCHSLWNPVAPGFTAGEDYYNYFQPVLEYGTRDDRDLTYWPDGRPRRFSNDAIGLWQSECFLRGGATCTSCHNNPHEPDIDRNPQLAAANNALCTQCHEAIGSQLTAHTRHGRASAGSSCVECHMPKSVMSIKATMRDHTISLPAPENTVAFGIPNACSECHTGKKPAWAVEAVRKWWPADRRAKMHARAEAFTAARARRPEALAALVAIARDDGQGPYVQANAVGYLRDYADGRSLTALLAAAKAEHPIIRSIAMTSLGHVDGQSREARAALNAGLDDGERAVRISALLALVNSARGQLTLENEAGFRRVSHEFAAVAKLREDDGGTQRDLGYLQLLTGEFDLAADALLNSQRLEPDRPTTGFLLGLARLGQRRIDDALDLFRQVPPSDPTYSSAQERLRQLAPP